ncbi:sulfotransferase family protein [Alkalibacillus sp. S2W]|uniref:sulfotransferase family protein n=1 Tax=Alkalibacillus sp. S2W TaxID=3386553 RepID=UPI00398CFE79
MKAIIIIGAARSGTKMLGNVFSMHPDVSYFGEVNQIWRTGQESLSHDALSIDQQNVVAIRNKFKEKCKGDTVIVEKTAANSLRLPLIAEVFDDVRFIHIVRDGRDVALSAAQKWQGENSKFERETLTYGNSKRTVIKRMTHRLKNSTFKEFVSLVPKGINASLSFWGIKKETTWGPVVPGLKEFRKNHSLIETCAYQWMISEIFIKNYFASNTESKVKEVKYEDFCNNPNEFIKEFFKFTDLQVPRNIEDINESVKTGNEQRWKKELTDKDLKNVENLCADLLRSYNYDF